MGLEMYLHAQKCIWSSTIEGLEAAANNPLIQDLLDAGLKQSPKPFSEDGDFSLNYITV